MPKTVCFRSETDFVSPPSPSRIYERHDLKKDVNRRFPPATPADSCYAIASGKIPRHIESVVSPHYASLDALLKGRDNPGKRPISLSDRAFPLRVKKLYGKCEAKIATDYGSDQNMLFTPQRLSISDIIAQSKRSLSRSSSQKSTSDLRRVHLKAPTRAISPWDRSENSIIIDVQCPPIASKR